MRSAGERKPSMTYSGAQAIASLNSAATESYSYMPRNFARGSRFSGRYETPQYLRGPDPISIFTKKRFAGQAICKDKNRQTWPKYFSRDWHFYPSPPSYTVGMDIEFSIKLFT